MPVKFIMIIAIFSFVACGKSTTKNLSSQDKTVNTKDTCESPDADINCCFVNMPDNLTSVMNIADNSEKGERIIIKGKLLKEDETTPYSDVIIYAYHTDANGYYSKKGNETGFQKWHGHLHGWCKTDAEGRYEIHSIKPARYPVNEFPAHIHWAIKKPNGDSQYLNDFVFSDDSLVTDKYLSELNLPGDNGVITLKENGEGVLIGDRVTVLE